MQRLVAYNLILRINIQCRFCTLFVRYWYKKLEKTVKNGFL